MHASGQHPHEHHHCSDAVHVPNTWNVTPSPGPKSYPTQPLPPTLPPGVSPMAGGGAVIDMCLLAPELLQGYIDSHPEVLTQKGFNGQTLLHRAVLSAQPEAVRIVLDNGVDPNVGNNYAETPLHFACKRGSPDVVHMLMNKGGDASLVDNGGKGLVLHATHSGAVPTLHYLSTVIGLSLQAVDKSLNSPLHVSCTHGHADCIIYLLKKGRSDIHQCNSAGDTALHIAARHGHSMACWQLLQVGGIPLLHQPNYQGHIPVDLARRGTQHSCRSVVKMLEYYSKQLKGGRGEKMTGPWWVWWLMLLLPFLLYGLGLGATQCFPQHAGYVMMACMLVLMTVAVTQKHRLAHICRWPNPMFVGMFAAGVIHTMFCYYAVLFPDLYPDHVFIVTFTLLYNVVILYMYIRLLIIDPGVVKSSERKPNGEEYNIRDVGTGFRSVYTFCGSCEIMPPSRTKHCKLCEVCYIDMDHHCLFLYRCVARHNHRLFVRFILVILFAQILYVYLGVLFIQQRVTDRVIWRLKRNLWSAFHEQSWLWSTMLANFSSVLWGISLLNYQFKVIGKGHTMFFQPNFGRTKLRWSQRVLNIMYFLLGRRPYVIDPQLQHLIQGDND